MGPSKGRVRLISSRWLHLTLKGEGGRVVARKRYFKGDILGDDVPQEEIDRLIEAGAAAYDSDETGSDEATPETGEVPETAPEGQDDAQDSAQDDGEAQDEAQDEVPTFNVDTADYDAIKAYAVEHDIHAIVDGVESFKKKDLVAAIKQHQA